MGDRRQWKESTTNVQSLHETIETSNVIGECELEKVREDLAETQQALEEAQLSLQQKSELLLEANSALEHFVFLASHELQEPLRAVALCMQLLSKEYGNQLEESAKPLMTHAVEGAERMQLLLADLLEYARVSTRGRSFGPVDLRVMWEELCKEHAFAIETCRATVTMSDLPTVTGDGVQLRKVFGELLKNALAFRRKDGPVTVRIEAERQGEEWVIAVHDNGVGISADNYERVFGVFKRLVTREEVPGAGMGLALCARIVARHGGRIWLTSEVGRGSTFYVALPDLMLLLT